MDDFVSFAHDRVHDDVRDILLSRGVTPEQIALYRIGYIERDLPTLPYPDDFVVWAKHPGRFDRVLVFPLTTSTGTVAGFQVRALDRTRKGYMNYMPYREEAVLFGLAQAMPHVYANESLWLVEGAFDLFPIQRHFPGVVATLTAKVPGTLVPLMRRLARRIFMGYDADPAGESATKQFIREYRSEFDIQHVRYPRVKFPMTDQVIKDPADLWEVWGDEQVGRFVKSVLPTEIFDV